MAHLAGSKSPSGGLRIYYGHNSRSEELITQRLALVKRRGLTTDSALLAA
jgi:hypothetical protein